MATLTQLKAAYLGRDQSTLENAWSLRWGGTHHQWVKTIYPRVCQHLPTGSVLEIGCGRGMISQHLLPYCRSLTLVDFINTQPHHTLPVHDYDTKISFIKNNGTTLEKIPTKSIDFAFSFFSLVDANIDTMESYIKELDRVLTSEGSAFIHHSNALQEPSTFRTQKEMEYVHEARADDVNAQVIKELSNEFNLNARIQECVSWVSGCPLVDCFTTLVRSENIDIQYVGQYSNLQFEDEVRYGISNLSNIYGNTSGKRL